MVPELQEKELKERIRVAPLLLIAGRVRRARKTAGLTHDALGDLMGGVYRQNLIKLEQGKHRPKPETLSKIAVATGRDVGWFLDPEVDPSPFPDGDGTDGVVQRAD